jgi:hypothetical protein
MKHVDVTIHVQNHDPFDDFWADTRGTELELEQGDDECDYELMEDDDED